MSRICWGIFLALLAGCHAPGLQFCGPTRLAGNPEALAGARAAPAVEARFGGVLRNTDAERRMESLGRRLTRDIPQLWGDYHFRLLDSNRVNAVSLPGGYIYVTQGLYARIASDDLLAAVLAHELAHIAAKDHFKPRCGDADEALDKELSADTYAAGLLDAAGIRRTALIDLLLLIKDAQPVGWAEARVANLAPERHGSHNVVACAETG